jgi:hypothetical protein
MGQGIDLARPNAPMHAAVLDNFKDQLLIALVERLGGKVTVPVADVDATGRYVMLMSVRDGHFEFELQAKS